MGSKTNQRNFIIALSIRHRGDWDRILDDIRKRAVPTDDELIAALSLRKGVKAITILDDEYPERLKHIQKPPFVIYCEGDASILTGGDSKVAAIIGDKRPSSYSSKAAARIAAEFADAKATVAAPFLKGIGESALAGAITAGGDAIAVLGCGLADADPEKMPALPAGTMAASGGRLLRISEYPDGTAWCAQGILAANRLVAGLSDAVVVAECEAHSSAVVTTALALDAGKDVYAVPQRAGAEGSYGNELIKRGAGLCESASDVTEGWSVAKTPASEWKFL